MHFSLIIRGLIGWCICFQLQSQNDSLNQENSASKFKFLHDESRQYLGSVSFVYQIPSTYGNNFMGGGLDGKDGFGFDVNFFLFKNFYFGLNCGIKNFNVIDVQSVGNYKSTQIEERYITVGYELLPISKIRMGIYSSIYGEATLSNKIEGGQSNRDSGKFWNYGLRLEYEFTENLNFAICYDWRHINSNIRVPSELETYFEKGTYNVLSLGLKFNFGRYDAYDHIYL